jgi:hypothetical protein
MQETYNPRYFDAEKKLLRSGLRLPFGGPLFLAAKKFV